MKCKQKDTIGRPHLHKGKYPYYECKDDNGKVIKYHRYIMQKHLNRKLNSNEWVHHIDGNTLNNSIENLKIMSQKEHKSHHYTVITEFICQWCNKKFIRHTRKLRKFCSLSCSSKYGQYIRKS